ncbi:hypothetical protein INT44_000987 [Umbelopsis vinacea]|uniref:RING-type E3 ubiquitin transferase BRCA1 n=1 Tax=Umbelopsis vinacea TaxID=44442 RepID=A0A8H7QAD7_9FUNG|nr:hypothetical protein INT44_000987 [Umbelopsis vinacea]
MSRITNAFERMQLSLACPICHKALVNTRIVSECGHFSCQDCVLYEIGEKGRCPQCQLPAIVKNLQPYHTLDILSVCLQKLRSSTYNSNVKVASCSFADDESLPFVEGYNKRRRTTPAGQYVMGTYSYEEIEYAEVAMQTPKIGVGINEEVQASQEDQEIASKSERPASTVRNESLIDRKTQLGKVVKLDHTGLVVKDEEEVNAALLKIGGTDITIEVYKDTEWIDDEVTHVITSMDNQHLCKRTQKYLSAIVKGKWVLGHQWLVQSMIAGQWLDEREYEAAGDLTMGNSLAPLRSAGARILQRRPRDGKGGQLGNGKLDIDRPLIVMQDIPTEWKKSQNWLMQYQVVSTSWILNAISWLSLEQPIP